MNDSKVIKLYPSGEDILKTFHDEVVQHSGDSRPMLYIGKKPDGSLVIHTMEMSWPELAHVKTALDMHVTKDWLGML